MSLAQIKQEAEKLSDAEQAELERYLKFLKLTRDPGWKDRAAEGRRQIETGEMVTQEQLQSILRQRDL